MVSGADANAVRPRAAAYAAVASGLCLLYLSVKGMSWSVSNQFHTVCESVATVLALCTGALALVRFYSRRENTFLFIGTGFLVTGLLNAYHALVTIDGFRAVFPRFPIGAIEWSWLAAPLFLSLQLLLSWLAWHREKRLGEAGRISERLVYAAAAAGAVVFFMFFTDVAPSDGDQGGLAVPRLLAMLPPLVLLLALAGYLSKGCWRFDPFEHWLVLALVVGAIGQGVFMGASKHAGDPLFVAGHCLKIVFYACAFIGLLADMRVLYSESLARRELTRANLILETQQETSQDGILVVNEDDRIVSYNRHFIELWGLPVEMVRRRDDRPVLAFVREQVQDREAFLKRVRYLYDHKTEESHEEIRLLDGRIFDRYSAPMIGANGVYYGRIWYFRDITARKRDEQAVLESEEKFRGLVDQSLVGIALVDAGHFTYVNHKFAAIFGYQVHEMKHVGPAGLASEGDRHVVVEALRRQLHPQGDGDEFTFQGVRKNGQLIEVEGRSARMNLAGRIALMLIVLDVTARVRAEREIQLLQSHLREQAVRDPLTGLYNRRYLAEALKDELARAARGRYPVSLVMGDIDHFKVINDTYGHLAGDCVLKSFAGLIKQNSRASDVACRYGGEEFLIVIPGMTKAAALERTETLRRAFAERAISHGDDSMRATASFGVAVFPDDGADVGGLIHVADEGLYAAKRAGRNRVMAGEAETGEPVAD